MTHNNPNACKSHRIAVVILNWNGANMMRRYLPSVLAAAEGVADVVVADNASTDDSLQMLKVEFGSVRTIVLDKNYGFAEGYNRALQQVDAEYYVLLNSDVFTPKGWIDTLLQFMDAHPEAAACQPKLLAEHNHKQFEYAGASGGYIDRYGYPFCRGRLFDTVEHDNGQYDDVCEVAWATGACLMIRSTDYWSINGLDPRFFAHNEEIDLCWRLGNLGRKIYCVPQSKVYHVGGGTLPKGNPMKTYLNFRNNLTMLYKNLPDADLRHVMRVRFCLDWVAALKVLIADRNPSEFKAILKARKDFKQWRNNFDTDRQQIQATRTTNACKVRTAYAILWQYYAKHVRRYADLPKA